MRAEGAEKLEGMILWWADLQGAKVVPGAYQVSLNINGEIFFKPFNILADPRTEASMEDMKKQYMFVSEINATIDEAHKSLKQIKKINDRLKVFIDQYDGTDSVQALVDKAKKLKESFTKIENELYQTKNKSNQDPLNFPIKLTNKLGHLNSLVTLDDFPPTAQDIEVKNELTAKINTELEAYEKLISEEITNFNKEFNQLQLEYLILE